MEDQPVTPPESPAPPPESPAPPPESMAPPPAAASSWQAPAPAPPPRPVQGIPGFVYADVPNRFFALIIDGIVLFVLLIVIGIILAVVGIKAGPTTANTGIVSGLVYAVISLAVGGAYFVYSWTRMRATVGMKALGMQVGNAYDGKTLTTEQAIRRYIALWGPSTLSGALSSISGIGGLIGWIVFIYLIYLLYSTAKSPTKQGFHDVFANTVVVKAARGV
jgi:uncharacterized RDD family membrane protein YckC